MSFDVIPGKRESQKNGDDSEFYFYDYPLFIRVYP
jgi:hypothetical protein